MIRRRAVLIPLDLYRRVEALAEAEGVPVAYIVARLVRQGLPPVADEYDR